MIDSQIGEPGGISPGETDSGRGRSSGEGEHCTSANFSCKILGSSFQMFVQRRQMNSEIIYLKSYILKLYQ